MDFVEPFNSIVCFGGYDYRIIGFNYERNNDITVLSIEGGSWSAPHVAGRPPSPRGGTYSCCVKNVVYYYGSDSSTGLHDLHMLTIDHVGFHGFTWSCLSAPGLPRGPRESRRDVAVGYAEGRLFCHGGHHARTGKHCKHLEFYDFRLNEWFIVRDSIPNSNGFTVQENFKSHMLKTCYLPRKGLLFYGHNLFGREGARLLRGIE